MHKQIRKILYESTHYRRKQRTYCHRTRVVHITSYEGTISRSAATSTTSSTISTISMLKVGIILHTLSQSLLVRRARLKTNCQCYHPNQKYLPCQDVLGVIGTEFSLQRLTAIET